MEPAPDHLADGDGRADVRDGDHDDHIHVGFSPDGTDNGRQAARAVLKPGQWDKLLDRISEIDNPTVPVKPSKYSLPAKKGDKASNAHIGE